VKEGQTYGEMLKSVRIVPTADAEAVRMSTAAKSDAEFIEIVEGCILSHMNTKLTLVKALAANRRMSEHAADAFIRKYTGHNPEFHRWDFDRGSKGVQLFRLLPRPVATVPTDPADVF
jgi:hypothetical protein